MAVNLTPEVRDDNFMVIIQLYIQLMEDYRLNWVGIIWI